MSARPEGEEPRWLDDPKNVTKIYRGLVAACVLLIPIDLVADLLWHKHVHYGFEKVWGFHGYYGLLSCVFLVLAAKQLRKVVKRPEDYYEAPDD